MTRLFSLIAVLFALTGCSGAPYPTALHVEATPAPVPAPMPAAPVAAPMAALVAAPVPAAVLNDAPNGRNVNMVVFGNGGTAAGSFRLASSNGEWVETGVDHQKINFRFREVNRDDWSVYLNDASRGVDIQLDLHTKKVLYSDRSNPQRRELYSVLDASARMNGWLVTRVTFGGTPGGSFAKTGNQWIERGVESSRPLFRFRETARDDWSVYLRDDSRQVDIQIDLHTGNIYYSDPQTARSVLYRIKESG